MSAALTLSAAGAATAAIAVAPAPPSSLVPPRVGGSVSYHYDAVETGPRGTTNTRAVLTLTRVVNDRVTITVTPDDGPATAVVARIGRDGVLQADAGDVRARGYAGGEASDIPLDRPLGGIPGDSRGPSDSRSPSGYGGGGGYGSGYGAAREARAEIPESVRVLAALVGSRTAAGANARSWPFAAAFASQGSVAMTARAGESHGTETTVVADGSGDVQIAAARDTTATRTDGGAGDNGGRRGGDNGGQRGAGGIFFPGGGQGGVYGGGRGRRGGQTAGGQYPGGSGSGASAQQRTVPASVALHVESTFRGGRLVLAHGSDTRTAHATGGDVTTTVRWTLSAL